MRYNSKLGNRVILCEQFLNSSQGSTVPYIMGLDLGVISAKTIPILAL